MALLAGGIAIEAFGVEIFDTPVRKAVALLLIVLGMLVSGGAFLRWRGVENAIRHGIAPRRAPGRLDLRIVRNGTRLELHLLNDLPDTDATPSPPDGARDAVGLDNVRGRLARLYPGDAALQTGIEGDRYHVRLTLPLRLHTGASA